MIETVENTQAMTAAAVNPHGECESCRSKAAASPPAREAYVYAVGRVEVRFPTISVEKEFAQALARSDTAGKTDQQSLQAVLAARENRYLVRQLCWVLHIQGVDSYLLLPRDPADLDLLARAVRPSAGSDDVDVVIGMCGPVAPAAMCNGLTVPIVLFDQLYSFDRASLIKSLPKPEKQGTALLGPAAEELFSRILQLTDNAGSKDEHRALNYLAMRYSAIYTKAAEQFSRDFSLTSVEASVPQLGGVRRLVDIVFVYADRNTDFKEKFSVRVDVSEEFPFLVSKLSPHYDREVVSGAR